MFHILNAMTKQEKKIKKNVAAFEDFIDVSRGFAEIWNILRYERI